MTTLETAARRITSEAAQPVRSRWVIVVGAILIQLCLGIIYAWSVFTPTLKGAVASGGYGFSASQTQWVFSAGLASFAVVMLGAGRWQARIGPRKVAMLGGIVLGVGYILGGLLGRTFLAQLLCIGLIGGAGIGMAYVIPIAVGVKWFPDKKGLITGLALAGFGFGATIWVKLASSWFGGLLNTTHVLGLPGVQSVFVIYGLVFLVLVLLGSSVMVNPPAGWRPAGWNPSAAAAAQSAALEMSPAQMARTPQYWGLLLMFTGSAMAGLMVIGCISLFGTDSLVASGAVADRKAAELIAGTAMAWFAILNGCGRIIWGSISDNIGRRPSLVLLCTIQAAIMFLFYSVGGWPLGLIVGACVIGFNFGGNLALPPAATADFFGNKNVGANYPWVFLAYGLAGILGPQISGYFKDAAVVSGGGVSAWRAPFMIAGATCVLAAALGLLLKTPKKAEAPTVRTARA